MKKILLITALLAFFTLNVKIQAAVDADTTPVFTIGELPAGEISGNESVEEYSTETYTISPSAGITTLWYVEGGNYISSDNQQMVVEWQAQGQGMVTVHQKNNDTGCESYDTLNVTILSAGSIIVNAGTDKEICEGESVQIGTASPASGGVEPYTFKWTPAAGLDNPDIAMPAASPDAATVYTLTVTDSRDSTGQAQVTVTVHPLPQPQITGNTSVKENKEETYSVNTPSGTTNKWYVVSGGTAQGGDDGETLTVLWGSAGAGELKVVQTSEFGCVDSALVQVQIQADTPSLILEVVDKDFGEYPVHDELKLLSSVTIRNNSTRTITIDSLVSSSSEFEVNEKLNTILPGKSANVSVSFKPSEIGLRNGILTAYAGSEWADGNLTGTGIAMPDDAQIAGIELSIEPDHAKPGDKVYLYLRLVSADNLPASARDFETTIGLNPYVLYYNANDLNAKEPSDTRTNFDDRFENRPIEIRGRRRLDNDVLVKMELEVLLGTEDTTQIIFKESPVWTDASVPVYTILKDSIFIVDICRADGERLLKFKDDESFISGIMPHPVENGSDIKYFVSEQGVIRFNLINALGEEVKSIFSKEASKGFGMFHLETEALTSGVYLLIMEIDGRPVDKKQILIVR